MALPAPSSTRTRVAPSLATALGLFVLTNLALLFGLVFPSFARIERDEAIRNIDRVAQALQRELGFLEAFSRDWAHWDAAYEFVSSPSEAFIIDSLTEDATSHLEADALIFFSLDHRMVFSGIYRTAKPLATQIDDQVAVGGLIHEQLVSPLLKAESDSRAQRSAVVSIDDNPLLVVATPILHSDGGGPARGVLLMIDRINAADLLKIQLQTLVRFEFTAASAAAAEIPEHSERFNTTGGNQGWIESQTPRSQRLAIEIATLGDHRFQVHAEFPRLVTAEGRWVLGLTLAVSTAVFAALLSSLYVRLLATTFLRPMRRITSELERIENQGDLATRLPEIGAPELQRLAHAFNRMMGEIELQKTEIAALSLIDSLTGLANRRRFDQALAEHWAFASSRGRPLALMLVDVDCFKAYNDRYGHPAGDACLVEIAKILREGLGARAGLLARYGGEEFVLLLDDCPLDDATTFADALRSAVQQRQLAHGASTVTTVVTLSLGVRAGIPAPDERPERWISDADYALYSAKRDGRDRVRAWRG